MLPGACPVVVQVEIYIRPTKSPGRERERERGWGQRSRWRWRLLSSAHKFTKISQPTDPTKYKKREPFNSTREGWARFLVVREGEVERGSNLGAAAGVSCCRAQLAGHTLDFGLATKIFKELPLYSRKDHISRTNKNLVRILGFHPRYFFPPFFQRELTLPRPALD